METNTLLYIVGAIALAALGLVLAIRAERRKRRAAEAVTDQRRSELKRFAELNAYSYYEDYETEWDTEEDSEETTRSLKEDLGETAFAQKQELKGLLGYAPQKSWLFSQSSSSMAILHKKAELGDFFVIDYDFAGGAGEPTYLQTVVRWKLPESKFPRVLILSQGNDFEEDLEEFPLRFKIADGFAAYTDDEAAARKFFSGKVASHLRAHKEMCLEVNGNEALVFWDGEEVAVERLGDTIEEAKGLFALLQNQDPALKLSSK